MLTELVLGSLIMQTGPLQGQALLDDMSKRAVQFYWDQSHPTTGFTKDRAANFATSDSYTVGSVASIGFSFIGLSIGAERGWIPRQQALERARLTMNKIRTKALKANGWLYHWLHWQNGTRQWNSEVSSIDTSICLAGAIVANSYFKDASFTADFLAWLNSINWQWMLTDGGSKPSSISFCMGWSPESGWINARWSDYSEQRMLYIQALGDDIGVPLATWGSFPRTISTYSGMEYVGGGPIFLHQMAESFIDFRNKRDRYGHDYGTYSDMSIMANRKYCMNNPGHFAAYGPLYWGLNACDTPDGYRAVGAPGWGMGEGNGTISPTGVAASIQTDPQMVMNTLNSIITNYPNSYGRYGFANGINAHRNWIDPDVIGIDLGMAMCAIENFRDRFVWRMSEASSVMRSGMSRAGFKSFHTGLPSEGTTNKSKQ